MYANIGETAKHFNVSESTIRKWLKSGAIPADTYIKVDDVYRIDLSRAAEALHNAPSDQETAGQSKLDLSAYNGD